MWTRLWIAIVLLMASLPCEAQLRYFQTRLELQEPVANSTGVNTVVYRWSTEETSGIADQFEVRDLTLILFLDQTLRYQDDVIVDGVVQLYDGLTRQPEIDYFWRFNLDTGGLEQMVNAGYDLADLTTGEHFVVNDSISIPDDNIVDVSRFVEGENQDGQSDFLNVQTTEQMIFFDGFEGGSASRWSAATP